MKNKIIVIVSLLLFTLFISIIDIKAGASWKYVWNNTTITIPLGESFDKYKNLPNATLYKDNIPLSDTSITYNTEGDWLYYSKNINTSKVGIYKVWYKAYESKYIPGTCTDYKCLVTFNVKDLDNPVIKAINDIVKLERGTEYDLMNNISVVDNYSKNINVEFNESNVTENIGTHNIIAKAVDESGNAATTTFIVEVYDNAKPKIESLSGSSLNIPLGINYDIKSNFKATDLYDGDISNKIVYPEIINDQICDYDYTVSVENSYGNRDELTISIHVIDDVKPQIIISNNNIILDYKVNIDNLDLTKYIRIEDNNSIDYSNLTITHDIINKVGNYIVNYEYNDGNYITNESLNLSLVSHEAPIIKVDNIVIDTESSIDILDYIHVIDDSDPNIEKSLIIDDKDVNYDKEGTYYANLYCINSSGLSTEKKAKIVIKNKEIKYNDEHKNYSFTTIGLIAIIGILVIVNISYIFISRRNKISKSNIDSNNNL